MDAAGDPLAKLRRLAQEALEKAERAEGRTCLSSGCECPGFRQHADLWGGEITHGSVCRCGHPLAHHLMPREPE